MAASSSSSKLFGARNTQLPSPVSPITRPSPSPPTDRCKSYTQVPESSGGSNLIPIKGFMCQVLCRSRTSTGVLQTVLCYLEAVRAQVPDLICQKTGQMLDCHAEPELPGLCKMSDLRMTRIMSSWTAWPHLSLTHSVRRPPNLPWTPYKWTTPTLRTTPAQTSPSSTSPSSRFLL